MIARLSMGLTIVAALALAPRSAAADTTLPFSMTEAKLDNGLRLVMVPYDSPGLVAYYSVVRVGSRDEVEKGVTGFAHFFEHMMFRGTDQWPPPKVQKLLEKAGADQNGFTTDDFTCYTFIGSNAYLDELVEYEADRFQNLKYTVEDFKTESGAVLGEYNKSTSGTYLPIQERLRSEVFERHTYGHTTLGYKADIEDMPNQFEYSRKFFSRFYTPDNVVLIVVGDFDPAKLETMVREKYGPWNRKRAKTDAKKEPAQRKAVRAKIDFKEKTLPMLSMSWRTPATNYDSKDTAVYNVVFQLLFGKTADTYTNLVLKEQKVAAFSDWTWNHRDPYYFQVVATVKDPADLETVEKAMQSAVDGLARGKLDESALEAVKSNVRYGMLLGLTTPDEIASALAFSLAPTGQTDGLQRLLAAIEGVKKKDVVKFAKRYFTAKNRAVVTLVSKGADK